MCEDELAVAVAVFLLRYDEVQTNLYSSIRHALKLNFEIALIHGGFVYIACDDLADMNLF